MRSCLLTLSIVSMLLAAQQGSGQEQSVVVGSKAPGFSLPDQQGQTRTLDDLLKKRHVALVFHRSADW